MPNSSLPPEEQPRVKPFDPLVLDKTVIAIPLLERMQADFDRIDAILKDHPSAEEFNTALQYDEQFPGGLDAAWRELRRIAIEGAKKTLAVVEAQTTQVAAGVRPRLERRRDSLRASIESPAIPPPLSGHSYGFATLDAGVVRRVAASNKRLEVRPILQIGPTRFEIIIDLNLEYPGGRLLARQWVLDNIDRAKHEVNVHDEGQDIHWEKDNASSQYLWVSN